VYYQDQCSVLLANLVFDVYHEVCEYVLMTSKPCTMFRVRQGSVGGKLAFWSFERLSVCWELRNKEQCSLLSFWLLFIISGKHYLQIKRLLIKCLL